MVVADIVRATGDGYAVSRVVIAAERIGVTRVGFVRRRVTTGAGLITGGYELRLDRRPLLHAPGIEDRAADRPQHPDADAEKRQCKQRSENPAFHGGRR